MAAGSLFAQCQSMGALCALSLPWAVGAVAVGGLSYGIYKVATAKTPDQRLEDFFNTLRDNKDKRDKFWGSIGL